MPAGTSHCTISQGFAGRFAELPRQASNKLVDAHERDTRRALP